ncbi:hypothetical protein [Starkeya sp. ORNL1]|uniref:hypothetical protein n=1 Tax=Starkeya sp. ORNL1 TaxID=2709380 RepID=UPI0019814AFE|nr:hypothetical protein [Starkeya sp. ORNL1]
MNCNIRPLAKKLPALLPGLVVGSMVAGGLAVAPAQAQQSPAQQLPAYGFRSPPSAQANRIYSVNSATGEMSACQFERPEGSLVGVTKCFAKDASAGPQKAGSYELISTLYSGETGVFRVNRDTGEMSVCYVRDMPKAGGGTEASVVCTPPAK